MAYTVLARRYRSQLFDDVIGQDAVAQTLKNAIKTDRVAHAYLFCGTRGVGKTTMARVLAKCLNCLSVDAPTIEPCCKCESCVSVNTGDDIDVIEIDGASNNGVDNIRELRNNAIFKPARSRYKLYIIDEIHMLSPGAFNALLKILEEPPAHVKFIFATTEPNKVLPTIQSRCQRFDFRAIDAASIGSQLEMVLGEEKISFEPDFIIAASRIANGSMRDALSLLDQVISTGKQPLTLDVLEKTLGQPGREQISNLLNAIGDGDAGAALELTDMLLTEGMSCLQIADSLVGYMRDVMVASTAGRDSSLVILTQSERQAVAKIADKFDIPALVYGVTAFERMRETIKNSDNSRAILEASIIRITLSEHFISVQSLMQRLAGVASAPVKKKNFVSGSKQIKQPAQPAESNSISNPAVNEVRCENIEQLKSNWNNILQALTSADKIAAINLKAGKPTGLEKGILELEFANGNTSLNLLADKARNEKLSNLLSKVIGQTVKIKAYAGTSAQSNKPPRPKGAKTSTKQRQEVLNNPKVKTILSAFDAQVLDITSA